VHLDEPAFDIEKGLAIAGGREDIFKKVLWSFNDATPKLLEELEQAVETVDRERIVVLIHRLKGSSRCVGASQLAAWAQSLEAECRNMKPVLLERSYDCLLAHFRQWKIAFDQSQFSA